MPPPPDLDLLLAHDGYVRALARRLVFDAHAAEDVVQETWCAALAKGPRDARSLRGWLAALVRNRARDAGRREARRRAREREVARDEEVPSTDAILELEEARRRVVEAVLALDEPYRSTVLLRHFPPRPPREVARRLGVPVETVRTRTRRAHQMLRARLGDQLGGEDGRWAPALVAAMQLEPDSVAQTLLAATHVLGSGALLMSTANKLALGAAAALLIALPFVLVTPRPLEPSPTGTDAPWAAPTLATPGTAVAPATADPVRVAAAPEEPAVEAPAPPSLGSLLVEVTWGEDGSPAEGVQAQVLLSGRADPYHAEERGRTGPDGTFLLEGLEPGPASVFLDRGPYGRADVVAGEVAELALEVPPGFDVSGRVEDPEGRPVAGAEILLRAPVASLAEVHPATTSDLEGRFRLRALPPDGLPDVSARAPGFAPTPRLILVSSEGADTEVVLRFPGPGGELVARVTGPDGAPLAGARVLFGDEREFSQFTTPEGFQAWRWSTRTTATDDEGRFAMAGLPTGRRALQVRAAGCAPWRGEAEVFAGRTATVDVRLDSAARLSGRVVDGDGEPVAGVEVTAAGGHAFAGAWAHTDADGRFAMEDLPVGPFEIVAEGEERGDARATLVGVAGDELWWEGVLDPGLTLHGRVVAPGADLAGWIVTGIRRDGQHFEHLEREITDAGGRFELPGCSDGLYDLEVLDDRFATVAERYAVRPGAEEVVIEIDPARLAPRTVTLRGRVVDPEGRPVGGAEISERGPSATSFLTTTDGTSGRFELGPHVPGEWSVLVRAPGWARLESERIEAGPGEVADFGDLELRRGGTLRLCLVRAPGAPEADPVLTLRPEGGGIGTVLTVEGGEARSPAIPAGRYRVRVASAEDRPFALDALLVDVADEEETVAELRLHGGVPAALVFLAPAPPDADATPPVLSIVLRDAGGDELWTHRAAPDSPGVYRWRTVLRAGRYRVEASTETGLEGAVELTVEGDEVEREIELRPAR